MSAPCPDCGARGPCAHSHPSPEPENAAAPGTIPLRGMPMWELERTLEAISDLIVCKAWPEHDATFRIARMAVQQEINRRTYGTTKG